MSNWLLFYSFLALLVRILEKHVTLLVHFLKFKVIDDNFCKNKTELQIFDGAKNVTRWH